jgi:hypothetical protein
MTSVITIIAIGILATLFMDLWGLVRYYLLGRPRLDLRLVGRWIAHMPRGRFRHASIGAAVPVRGELLLGWAAHYLIGITFAALLVALRGEGWLLRPTLTPALLVGVGTVVAPLFLMQPGMGAGIAGARTPNPWQTRLQSLITHSVFGAGLYAAARLLSFI